MRFERAREYLRDCGLNTISFGIYIVMQQLVIMPVLSKLSNFSQIILFVTVFNIVSSVVGDELGNTRLVRANSGKDRLGDYNSILLFLIVGCVVICVLSNIAIGINWFDLCMYMIITILGCIRYFSMSYFKLKQHFGKILILNVCYCLGALIGIYVTLKTTFFVAAFLIGELAAFLYILIQRIKDTQNQLVFSITPEFTPSIKVYGQLGTVSLIVNCMYYFDRTIIYPILGSAAMAIYYSATSMSKMMSLVVNPISGVLLAKLTKIKDAQKSQIAAGVIKYAIPFFLFFMIGTIALSYIGLRLLYFNYFDQGVRLLVPIGIASSFALISAFIKPIIMRFYNLKLMMGIYAFDAAILVASIFVLKRYGGIAGFAWATCISQSFQCLCFMLMMRKTKRAMEVKSCDTRAV